MGFGIACIETATTNSSGKSTNSIVGYLDAIES